MGQYKVVIEQKSRKRWAAYGFLLLVALLVISWFLAPSLIQMLRASNRAFRTGLGTMEPRQLQIIFTLVLTLILALVSAIIVTLAAPKRVLNVNEKDLVKEREAGRKYHQMQKKRQRKLNREMREYREKQELK
jgi:di/tricarboxylate transporter